MWEKEIGFRILKGYHNKIIFSLRIYINCGHSEVTKASMFHLIKYRIRFCYRGFQIKLDELSYCSSCKQRNQK